MSKFIEIRFCKLPLEELFQLKISLRNRSTNGNLGQGTNNGQTLKVVAQTKKNSRLKNVKFQLVKKESQTARLKLSPSPLDCSKNFKKKKPK